MASLNPPETFCDDATLLLGLEQEQEELMQFVPPEMLAGLPPEMVQLLRCQVGKAREDILKTVAQDRSQLKKSPPPQRHLDKTDQDTANVEEDAKQQVAVSQNCLDEILHMVEDLDEDSSRYIYEQLQAIFTDLAEEEKVEKLEILREELLLLQLEQRRLMPSLPAELLSSVPAELARQLQKDMEEAFRMMAETNLGDTNNIHMEEDVKNVEEDMQDSSNFIGEVDNNSLIPSLPEDLLRSLPAEMVEDLRRNYEASVREMVRQEVDKMEPV